jgi:hypothetical protein
MNIGSNYPAPVTVNGYLCRNCTDVDYAKKHIDPAHPKSGPYWINAKNDPTYKDAQSSSLVLGGNLVGLDTRQIARNMSEGARSTTEVGAAGTESASAPGILLDVSA